MAAETRGTRRWSEGPAVAGAGSKPRIAVLPFASASGEAQERTEAGRAKDPEFADAYGWQALLYALGESFGFFEQSEAFRENVFGICRRALELDDRTSEVLGYVGWAYCDLHRDEEGVPLLERAVAHNPSNAQARAALGSAYKGLNRFQESASTLEAALEISPAYKGIALWATLLAGSYLYLYLDRQEDAAATIDRALRWDPNFFPAHLTAALVALRRGDTAAARGHMDEARRIQPDLNLRAITLVLADAGARPILQLDANA